MVLRISEEVRRRFPDLRVLTAYIEGVKVGGRGEDLDRFEEEVIGDVRGRYDLSTVKDAFLFRAYRDFFWRIKVDPTKTRPAAEALIRRILAGKPFPRINTFVDAYNLASVKSEIALAAFDLDKIHGDLTMRFAFRGEEFLGIGMKKPMVLEGGEVVISDEERLVAIYPHRDAEESKVTETTENVLLLTCGVPGIQVEKLRTARQIAFDYVIRFCGGVGKFE